MREDAVKALDAAVEAADAEMLENAKLALKIEKQQRERLRDMRRVRCSRLHACTHTHTHTQEVCFDTPRPLKPLMVTRAPSVHPFIHAFIVCARA